MTKLWECPFCGSDALKISPNVYTGLLRVQCEGCWATSVTSSSHAVVVAAWNRRPTSSAVAGTSIERRLLKELQDARYGVYVEENSIFCGDAQESAAYKYAKPSKIAAAKAIEEAVWRKLNAFLDAGVNPYFDGSEVAISTDTKGTTK